MITSPSLDHDLRQVARRLRMKLLLRSLTLVWLVGVLAAWLTYWIATITDRPWPAGRLALGVLLAAAIAMIWTATQRFDLRQVARRIERSYPELNSRLLAAYEQEATVPLRDRGYLTQSVIEQAQLHSRWSGRWSEAVPRKQLIAWTSGQTLALLLLLATFVSVPLRFSSDAQASAVTEITKSTASAPPEFDVEPGDIELERGADLLVLARFAEHAQLPNELTLLVASGLSNNDPKPDVAKDERLAMQQSLSDPIFAARVPEVRNDLTYTVVAAGQTSRPYRVTVFDYPALERSDAELRYPEYTELETRRIEDVRQVTAVEGTELTWLCRLNKPMASAQLTSVDGESLRLSAMPNDPTLFTAKRQLAKTERWRLELVDDRGRKNRESVEFVAKVVPNRPPELKLTFPRRDLKVSPLQELPLEAQVTDDFGVMRWGLSYELIGKKSESIVLGEKLSPHEKHAGKHVVALEDLSAQPDELLAWHVWAEDLAPDGSVRRTASDIFFAEVSPFEEIFREEQSESGTPGEQSNTGDEALKLQKEIIAATWNVRRRERPETLSSAYAKDVQVIADSQHKAIEQLDAMREKLPTPEAQAILATIEQSMRDAETKLRTAMEGPSLAPLDEALPAEQAAYQGLLRLRAKENRVSRSKSSQSGGGQQSSNGQDLDQLELSEDEQRYESRNRADEARQTPAQREREEFLNRLRELARRQEDVNQKIKELQASLDAAKSEEEKRELDRQLKRLRDEQRELLRDVDQLKSDVDQPKHNEPLAEASQQLDATREDVRQASDALEKGQVSQALTAGTRAERELDELRDDFRKQTASEYADEARELVDRARELDERQERIGEQLKGEQLNGDQQASGEPRKSQKAKGSLRSRDKEDESNPEGASPSGSDVAEQLERQRKELGELLDQTRQLTERAEANEPLMTKQLYDTLREAHQGQTQRAVDIMRQLVNSGLKREAAKVEPRAQQGVRQLREGIEKAAESVLGDDVESLRRAKRDVDQLARALAEEMKRENPADESRGDGGPRGEAESSDKNETADGANPKAKGKAASKGKAAAKDESPGKGKLPGKGESPMESEGTGEGEPSSKGKSPSKNGKASGKGKAGGASKSPSDGEAQSPGEAQGNREPSRNGTTPTPMTGAERGSETATVGAGGALNGPEWRKWSDSLRNVEEFVPGTRLRSAAARVREQAQEIRAESKRHSKAPNWDLVRETVYEPLVELQRELNEELLRRSSPEAVVPLDRDPVPDRFGEAVRRYYERLGSGQ
jgi:hypothetical protein